MSGVNGSGNDSALTMVPDGEESTAESTDAWKCKCGTVNDPEELPEDGNPDVCKKCGASVFDEDDDAADASEDGAGMPSIDDVKAGLQTLSGGEATAQDIENVARAEEGLPPLEPLLDFGPFNPDNALKAIFEKSAEVRALQADYDRAKEQAKDAKSELDIASKALVNIIESLKNRRTQALNPSQPFLRDVSNDAAPVSSSTCPWERAHPGQSCPVCTAANAKDLAPALESNVHPDHEGHIEIAEAARLKTVLLPLADALKARNVFIEAEELQHLSTEDLNALVAWNAEPGPIPPMVLTRCHIAAEPGSILQVCQRCECELVEFVTEASAYPVGALVGFECGKAPKVDETHEQAAPIAPAAEPTRTIKPRGSKKRAKKEPEQERAKQVTEGHQRGHPIPKSESARRGSGKAKSAKKAKR